MRYKVGSINRSSKYLDIELEIDNSKDINLQLILPSWRPGRYELGNFAKNIKGFQVWDEKNQPIAFEKVNKSQWNIASKGFKNIKITYQYYAAELNAGSTWVDENQIYINPVNCLMYAQGKESDHCIVEFLVPSNYIFATALKKLDCFLYQASSYDELADSPVICSPDTQNTCYKINDTTFNLWFQGECKPNWEKIIQDFTAFSKTQLDTMGSFPFKEYHFLFHILPFRTYHGVEHLSSTVITLGPGFALMNGETYNDLLGISSHELFHAWNVKTIRPSEMIPYDFTQENYSKLGYITEGITTYYGDLFLIRSGVFSEEQYFKLLHSTFDKHFFNFGRFNYSVTESSFDTWLDGYVKGAPNRKTSIYTEGSLMALATDILILDATKGEKCLDDVMRVLYQDFALKGKGITEKIYRSAIEKLVGKKLTSFFETYYHSAVDYLDLLKKTLMLVGLEITEEKNSNFLAGKLGCITEGSSGKVSTIAPHSPAEKAGLHLGDEIVAVNDLVATDYTIDWVNYFADSLNLTLKKGGKLVNVKLEIDTQNYFVKYRISKVKKTNAQQKKLYRKWLWN